MADLFDMSVGGLGWHIPTVLVALAALFVACFAITGHISFRNDSIPSDALKDGSGLADEDVTVNSLEVRNGGIILDSTAVAAVTDPFQLTKPRWARTASGQRANVDLRGYNFFGLDGSENTFQLAGANLAGSSTLALTYGITDFLGGVYVLTTDTGNGDSTEVCATNSNFRCTTGKPWWIECQFQLADHDATEFFFGVAEQGFSVDAIHVAGAGAGADRVGFVKVDHGDNGVTAAITNGSNGSVDQALTTALSYDKDNLVVTLGIHWDGAGKVDFYADSVATGVTPGNMTLRYTDNTAANQSSDATMLLRFFILNNGGAKAANINYIRGLQTA